MDINTEQLKMVLDMLQSAGENGKQMLIIWVCIHYGAKLAVGLIIAGIGALGLRAVVHIFSASDQLELIRDIVLPGRFAGAITTREYICTVERIRQLIATEEGKQSQPRKATPDERKCYQDKA